MYYCKNCGCKLHESMQFCYGCGEKIRPIQIEQGTAAAVVQEPYDPEAMKLYLSNLQTLEAARRKVKQDLLAIDDRIAALGKPGQYMCKDKLLYGVDENSESAACFDPDTVFKARLGKGVWLGLVSLLLLSGVVGYCVWQKFFSPLVSYILLGCTAVILVVFLVALAVKMNHLRRKVRKDREAYQKYVKADEERLNCEDAELVYLQKRRNRLCYEYGEAEVLLKKSYEADIIPHPLRNIGSVYYLQNCVAASKEPFAEILARCEAGLQSLTLSEIVAQKSDEVVRQAYARVQNEEWLRTADAHLQELLGMETDRDKVEKYYRIAAVHGQLTTWIRMADCMKEY